ncbi:hypothetical protein FRB99_002566 [Tulasnella sp. 403]|nr:hypothetical protein FRB99_002566 [Tulasnella sp. 403]
MNATTTAQPPPATDPHPPPISIPTPVPHSDASNPYPSVPFFDLSLLRRVKPLPRSKRRRMADEEEGPSPTTPTALTSPSATTALQSFPMPPYFYPVFSGYAAGLHQMSPEMAAHIVAAAAVVRGGARLNGTDDDGESHQNQDQKDRDQQGNTKKRKVPAAAHQRANLSDNDVAGDDRDERSKDGSGGLSRDDDGASVDSNGAPSPTKAPSPRGKPRLSPTAANAMKLKEIMKTRKRQMLAVLGPATLGENLALDLALAAPLNWSLKPNDSHPTKNRSENYFRTPAQVRRRKRTALLTAAAVRVRSSGWRCTLPSAKFTFKISCPTNLRMKAIMAEVSTFKSRFGPELVRLAAKQVETAKRSTSTSISQDGKRGTGNRKMLSSSVNSSSEPPSASPDANPASISPATNNTPSSKKKKKRVVSSKANDPHQIRNYVPSRLPSASGGPQPPTAVQAERNRQNLVSPHPVRFLAAEPNPRPRSKSNGQVKVSSSLPPVQPEDEWICSFCEYSLFYGDEISWKRAIRNRKALLNRRRRARERAAAAASGQGRALPKKVGGGNESGDEEEEIPEEEEEAKFVDPAEVEARVAASVNANKAGQGKPVVRDKDKTDGLTGAGTASAPASRGAGSKRS